MGWACRPRCAPADLHHGLGLSIVAAIARMHDGRPFATSDGLTTIGLRLYRQALLAGQMDMAEQLLRGLELLAATVPSHAALERAAASNAVIFDFMRELL